jgi:hypothetical protein
MSYLSWKMNIDVGIAYESFHLTPPKLDKQISAQLRRQWQGGKVANTWYEWHVLECFEPSRDIWKIFEVELVTRMES